MAVVAGARSIGPAGRPVGASGEQAEGLAYHWRAMFVIVLGTFMVVLDSTIVNIALPRIIQVFNTTVDSSQLVLTGYLVALAVVMPATSYLSSTFGSKRVYLFTVALFTIGSALCGFAPSIEGLIVFRVLQGLGGGLTQPLGMTILLQATPPRQRGSIMGVFGLPILVAPVIGPTLGGYIVEYIDWRLIFTINIPVGVLAVLLGMLLLKETPRRPGQRFDWIGFVLAAIGFSAAMLMLEKGPGDGWTAPHVVALGLVALAAIPSWIVVELAQEQPLLDLTVLKDRTFAIATAANFVATIALFGALLLLPLFLQSVRRLGAMETGLLIFPQAIAAGLMMPIAGRLVDRIGPRPLIVPGMLLLAAATYLLKDLQPGTSDTWLRLVLVMRGLAMGMLMMPIQTVMLDNIPPERIPSASALSNVLRQLFSAFGTGIITSILLDREKFHTAVFAQLVTPTNLAAVNVLTATQSSAQARGLSEAAAQAMGIQALMGQVQLAAAIQSFGDCFWLSAIVALFGVVPALFLRRQRRARAGMPGAVMMD